MRFFFLLLLSMLYGVSTFAQVYKIPDRVVLKSGTSETGKILAADSVQLRLRKADYSERVILWKNIDSVGPCSVATRFFAVGSGLSYQNYFSTFYFRTIQNFGPQLHFRYGNLKWGKRAWYWQYSFMPARPFSINKLGANYQRYVFSNYTQTVCAYLGTRLEMNLINRNKLFFNFGIPVGLEALFFKQLRVYSELCYQHSLFTINKSNSVTFNIGIRVNKEYATFYQKLNKTHQLCNGSYCF